jgi:hypothetical protein
MSLWNLTIHIRVKIHVFKQIFYILLASPYIPYESSLSLYTIKHNISMIDMCAFLQESKIIFRLLTYGFHPRVPCVQTDFRYLTTFDLCLALLYKKHKYIALCTIGNLLISHTCTCEVLISTCAVND